MRLITYLALFLATTLANAADDKCLSIAEIEARGCAWGELPDENTRTLTSENSPIFAAMQSCPDLAVKKQYRGKFSAGRALVCSMDQNETWTCGHASISDAAPNGCFAATPRSPDDSVSCGELKYDQCQERNDCSWDYELHTCRG